MRLGAKAIVVNEDDHNAMHFAKMGRHSSVIGVLTMKRLLRTCRLNHNFKLVLAVMI